MSVVSRRGSVQAKRGVAASFGASDASRMLGMTQPERLLHNKGNVLITPCYTKEKYHNAACENTFKQETSLIKLSSLLIGEGIGDHAHKAWHKRRQRIGRVVA